MTQAVLAAPVGFPSERNPDVTSARMHPTLRATKARVVRCFVEGAHEVDARQRRPSWAQVEGALFPGSGGPRSWRSTSDEDAREAGRRYASSEEGRAALVRRPVGRPRLANARTVALTVLLTPEEAAAVREAAATGGTSISDHVRALVLRGRRS